MTQEAKEPELELELELPEYHGRKPSGMKTSITGSGNRIQRPHEIGERVVIVIEARVKKAGHEDTEGDGLLYVESMKTIDLFEIPGQGGSRLIRFLRSSDQAVRDLSEGKEPLPEMGDQGWTDASGVVLTPEELAEKRGDPVSFLLGSKESLVVVWSDGSRALWPDEFPEDAPRPQLGDSDGEEEITEILNAETGESLEEPDEAIVHVSPSAPVEPDEIPDPGIPESPELEEPDEIPESPELEDETSFEEEGDFDIGEDDVPDFDDGPSFDDAPPLPDELPENVGAAADELEARLPTRADFEFVDCKISELEEKLKTGVSIEQMRRLVEAERQGRGRALKPRDGALKLLRKALLTMEHALEQEMGS